jgi:hypothetical protein
MRNARNQPVDLSVDGRIILIYLNENARDCKEWIEPQQDKVK